MERSVTKKHHQHLLLELQLKFSILVIKRDANLFRLIKKVATGLTRERVGDFLFAHSVKSNNSEKELKTTKSLTFISIESPYAFC